MNGLFSNSRPMETMNPINRTPRWKGVARATGPYRPATRRTEWVRRTFCGRSPFPPVRPALLRRAGSPAGRASGPCQPGMVRAVAIYPKTEVGNGIKRTRRAPFVAGRGTPCAPRQPPSCANFPRRCIYKKLSIMALQRIFGPTPLCGFNGLSNVPRALPPIGNRQSATGNSPNLP